MPKKNRVSIYEYLFKEGVLVAKKDFTLPKHPEIDVPNLHVIKALTVGTVMFINFQTQENLAVINLKFKQRCPTLGYFTKKMQLLLKQTLKTLMGLIGLLL